MLPISPRSSSRPASLAFYDAISVFPPVQRDAKPPRTLVQASAVDAEPSWNEGVVKIIECAALPRPNRAEKALHRFVHLGCGTGLNTYRLAGDVVGIDADPEKIQLARSGPIIVEAAIAAVAGDDGLRRLHVPMRPDLRFLAQAPVASDLPAGCADVVILDQAHHAADFGALVATADRLAKPGGAMVLLGLGVPRCGVPEVDHWLNYAHGDLVRKASPGQINLADGDFAQADFPYAAEPRVLLDGDDAPWATRKSNLHHLLRQLDEIPVIAAQLESDAFTLGFFTREIRKVWGPPRRNRLIRWPVNVRVGRKPL